MKPKRKPAVLLISIILVITLIAIINLINFRTSEPEIIGGDDALTDIWIGEVDE